MINTRLRTSKETDLLLEELQNVLNLNTKAAIARIAIGLSLQVKLTSEEIESLTRRDQAGFEFQRNTLFGEDDSIYKALILQHHGVSLSDQDYFPQMVYTHIERGMKLLSNEYRLAGNRNKLFTELIKRSEAGAKK